MRNFDGNAADFKMFTYAGAGRPGLAGGENSLGRHVLSWYVTVGGSPVRWRIAV